MTSEGSPSDPNARNGAEGGDDVAARMAASRPAPEPAAVRPGSEPVAGTPPPPAQEDAAPPPRPAAPVSGGGPQTPPAPPAAAPKRRRRREGAMVGYLSGVFTFLTLIVLALGGALYYGKASFDGPGPLAQDTTVMIARNQGVGEIAEALSRAGVIDQPRLFEAGVRFYGAKARFGEYAFPARVSMREAMEIIASGKSIEHTVTVPEGLTSLQIVERLREQPMLTGDVKETPPEGSLLPETYRFMRGTPREQLVARMRQHREAALEAIWKERDPSVPVKTPEELVVLASLIEKETGVAEERPRVASVFVNRLNKGMRLQSDPTIVYGLVGGRGTLGRSLNRADILSRTPYNTYVVSGLPAGPIANPGRESLEAAARPAKTSDLYFVADGSGGHAFAPSLVEHNRNVARWRQVERSRAAPSDRLAPDEATPEAPASEAAAEVPPAPPPPAGASSAAPGPAAGASAAPTPKPRPSAQERRRNRDP